MTATDSNSDSAIDVTSYSTSNSFKINVSDEQHFI